MVAVSNGKGQHQGAVTPLLEEFIDGFDGQHPVVDVGCGYGLNSFAALGHGIPTVAADTTDQHLAYVWAHWQTHRPIHLSETLLTTEHVCLPDSERQQPNALASSVLVSEVFHFLRPTEVDVALRTI